MNGSMCRRLAATTAAVMGGGLLSMSPAQAADDITINLVAVNDFHGQIDDNLVQWAATVEQVLADGSADNTLLLSAGDNVGESLPASSVQHDNPAIDVLNLLGLDASAVGNHEFDRGYDDLVNHIMARADYDILGANVKKDDGSAALDASTMFTASGVRIAVIGAVTEETPELVSPTAIVGLNFGDPVAAINAEVDRLNSLPESEQPDVIVATLHEGAPWGTWALDQAMASSSTFKSIVQDTSPDVDAIINGHTHNTYVYNAPVPGDPSRTRPVIQTGEHAQNVGQIKLTYSPDTGEVRAYTARNVARVTTSDAILIEADPTLAAIAQLRDDAVAYAADQTDVAASTREQLEAAEADGEVAKAAAEKAKQDYDSAVADGKKGYADAATIKVDYDAAIADGKKGYADATTHQGGYDAAIADGKKGYADAASIKAAYDAAVADGKKGYVDATTIRADYDAAIADGKKGYADATTIKQQIDAANAEGKAGYAEATTIKQQIDAASAEGRAANALAETLRQEYLATMASGDPDASTRLAELTQQFVDALAAAQAAYATATDLRGSYDAAMAAGAAGYATANELKGPYDAAMAAGQDGYARATGMVGAYNLAIAAGQDGYARATGMVGALNLAIAAGQDGYARATGMVGALNLAVAAGKDGYDRAAAMIDSYNGAIAVGKDGYQRASVLKQVLDAAIATLNTTLATITQLKQKLADLLDLLGLN